MSKVLLIEFNELCPALMDKWIEADVLPNFKKLKDESHTFITEPDVVRPDELEPWIQWFSMHTGQPYEKHGVFDLTDGPKSDEVDIWTYLESNGKKVGSFGSMNVKGFDFDGGFYVPDPWCTSERPAPSEYRPFHKIVSHMVREYTNESAQISLNDYVRFAWFLVTHGMRFRTVYSLAKQLISEKTSKLDQYWKRATSLDEIQIDIFRHAYKKFNPDFTTYFSNSTAHLQHSYWRHMSPEEYEIQPDQNAIDTYEGAIQHGYERMDWQIGELMKSVDEETTVIFATALSQQPFLKAESYGGQLFYRPFDFANLLKDLGVEFDSGQPTMTHQFMIDFGNVDEAKAAIERFSDFTLDGTPIFGMHLNDSQEAVYMGCQLRDLIDQDAVIQDRRSNHSVPFYKYFYKIDGMKSGCHHPDGILWVRSGTPHVHEEKASILDVFPTVTTLCGVPAKADMAGKSLV